MDGNEKLLAVFWVCLASVLTSIIVGVTATSLDNNRVMLEMVKSGADPLKVGCAVEGSHNSTSIDCNLLMAK